MAPSPLARGLVALFLALGCAHAAAQDRDPAALAPGNHEFTLTGLAKKLTTDG